MSDDSEDCVTDARWLRTTDPVDPADAVAGETERPTAAWPARPQTAWTSNRARWPRPIRLPRSA